MFAGKVMQSDLSVIIPLYSQRGSICATLDSLARQELRLELIIIDDASTDGGADTVRGWSEQNPQVQLRLECNATRLYAMRSRLRGVGLASCADIMFMDADDTLLGTKRLARALAHKRENGCEILHFRSIAIDEKNGSQGEFLSNAPLKTDGILRGPDVFATYAAKPYPPVLLWGKIYSKSLVEKVRAVAETTEIFRFDDKFLTSLLMLYSESYAGNDEYIYLYKVSHDFPMDKYAGRVHDLYAILDVITPLLAERGVSSEAQRNFQNFIKRRITVNMGKLCIEAEKSLFEGKDDLDSLQKKLTPFMDAGALFQAALLSSCNNVSSIYRIFKRLTDEY